MGAIELNNKLFPLSTHQWVLESSRGGPGRLMVDMETGVRAGFGVVEIGGQGVLEQFQFRARNRGVMVDVYGVLREGGESFCFGGGGAGSQFFSSKDRVILLYENIQYRITDLGPLTYPQSLYILSQSLNALHLLARHYKSPNLSSFSQQAIGINQSGECKIWVDEDYSKPLQFGAEGLEEAEVIERVFRWVEERMGGVQGLCIEEYGMLKESYLGKLGDTKRYTDKGKSSNVNFENALRFVKTVAQLNSFDLSKIRLNVPGVQIKEQSSDEGENNPETGKKISLKKNKSPQKMTESRRTATKIDYKSVQKRNKISLSNKKQQIVRGIGIGVRLDQVQSPKRSSRCTIESSNMANSYINTNSVKNVNGNTILSVVRRSQIKICKGVRDRIKF